MRLTAATDLALRILMRMAVLDEGECPPTREIAAAVGAPYSHAAKIVTRLQHLGVLDARRGRGGGLALTAAGRYGSVGRLVRALEGDGDVVGCDDDPPCPLRSGCRLRTALREAREAFYAALDPYTIDDLVSAPTGPLLIGLSPPARVG